MYAWTFPFYQKAELALLVCSLCYCSGPGTQKDLLLCFMFCCHSSEILNVLLNKESFIFILLWIPRLCSWLGLKDKVFADTSSESFFPSEHGTKVFWHSPWLERVGGQRESFLHVGHMILLPECLKNPSSLKFSHFTSTCLCVKLATLQLSGTQYVPASICRFVSENDPHIIYLGIFFFLRKWEADLDLHLLFTKLFSPWTSNFKPQHWRGGSEPLLPGARGEIP